MYPRQTIVLFISPATYTSAPAWHILLQILIVMQLHVSAFPWDRYWVFNSAYFSLPGRLSFRWVPPVSPASEKRGNLKSWDGTFHLLTQHEHKSDTRTSNVEGERSITETILFITTDYHLFFWPTLIAARSICAEWITGPKILISSISILT